MWDVSDSPRKSRKYGLLKTRPSPHSRSYGESRLPRKGTRSWYPLRHSSSRSAVGGSDRRIGRYFRVRTRFLADDIRDFSGFTVPVVPAPSSPELFMTFRFTSQRRIGFLWIDNHGAGRRAGNLRSCRSTCNVRTSRHASALDSSLMYSSAATASFRFWSTAFRFTQARNRSRVSRSIAAPAPDTILVYVRCG
jgi:hypothetical protein